MCRKLKPLEYHYQIYSLSTIIDKKKNQDKTNKFTEKKIPYTNLLFTTTPHTLTYEELRKFHSIFYLFCPLISLEFNEAQ